MDENTKKSFADRLAAARLLRLKAKRESDEIAAALPDVSGQKRLKVKTSSSSCSDHTSSAFNGQHTEIADAISRQFDALKRGTLRWRLEKALENGGIDEAERISDAIYNDEFLQRQPAPVSSSVGNNAGKNKLKSPKKRTRPSWRFTPKQSWETKGNM
nr:unnamed protein product [Spirometra erinaceieuropaei]